MIKFLQQIALAIALTTGASLAAHAQPPEVNMAPRGPAPAELPPGPHGAMPQPGMMPELAPPPFLHGLDLSEAQQDKIFSILLAEAPLLHEQQKLAHKNGKELHAFLEQDQYDEGKIKLLAEAQSHAMAQLMVLHARSMHQILAVLTPEQRAQLNAMKEKFADKHCGEAHSEEH